MDEQHRQAIANFRYGLIAPLVSRKLEAGEQTALMREIVQPYIYLSGWTREETESTHIGTICPSLPLRRLGSAAADRLGQISCNLAKLLTMSCTKPSRSSKNIPDAVFVRSSRSWN